MKKQLCTIASLLITTVAWSQTEKGNGLISGSISANITRADNKSADNTSHGWQSNLNLTAGHFVADNWLVGASVSVGTVASSSKRPLYTGQIGQPIAQQANSVSASLVPFVRRYWQFAPVQVFAGVGLSASLNAGRQLIDEITGVTPPQNTRQQRTTNWQITPYLEGGVNFFLTKRLALQVAASSTALPFYSSQLSTGLVYWTGSNRQADTQPERENRQTDKGNWLLEGSFSAGGLGTNYNYGSGENKQSSGSYFVSPSVGYFIRKNTMLGVGIPLSFTSNRMNGQTSPAYWSIGISPYYLHYWASTRLTPFTRVEATIGQMNSGSNGERIWSTSASVGLGLAYMAGQRFIIQTSLANVSLARTAISDSADGNGLWGGYLSAGLGGSFGLRYVLTRTK
jgi:hypothetical protein